MIFTCTDTAVNLVAYVPKALCEQCDASDWLKNTVAATMDKKVEDVEEGLVKSYAGNEKTIINMLFSITKHRMFIYENKMLYIYRFLQLSI